VQTDIFSAKEYFITDGRALCNLTVIGIYLINDGV